MKSLFFVVAVLTYCSFVFAQSATPLDRLQPAPAGDVFTSVPSAEVAGAQRLFGTMALSFAKSPLILVDPQGDAEELGDVVSHQMVAHGLVSVELFRRLKLELDLPLTLAQGGGTPDATPSPSGATLNDLRVGGRLMLLGQDQRVPAASVSLKVWLPTGNEEAFTSSGRVRFSPSIVVGATYDEFVWSAELGRHFDTSRPDNLLGPELVFGAGMGTELGVAFVSAELFGSTVSSRRITALDQATTNLEATLGARFNWGPIALRIAGGPGLIGGIGTPKYRLVTTIGYAPPVAVTAEPTSTVRDIPTTKPITLKKMPQSTPRGSARRSAVSASGSVAPASGVSGGRPLWDQDGDGVEDGRDSCPQVAGLATVESLGCPPDGDADGVPDIEDACPNAAGARSSEPKLDGCPLDTDKDGFVDTDDACPAEAGVAADDPKRNGCPRSVRVVGTQIVILDKIRFQVGRAHLLPEGEEIIQQVARVMREHPEIVRVSVDGHADAVGQEKKNIRLSHRRALAVMRALIGLGVDERRLEARGYGPRQPLVSNDTPEGRAQNRRVEFQILKRSHLNEAAWIDGPLE